MFTFISKGTNNNFYHRRFYVSQHIPHSGKYYVLIYYFVFFDSHCTVRWNEKFQVISLRLGGLLGFMAYQPL